jgi:hypothetical protein
MRPRTWDYLILAITLVNLAPPSSREKYWSEPFHPTSFLHMGWVLRARYDARAPRYADLSFDKWRAQTDLYPIDSPSQLSSLPWASLPSLVSFCHVCFFCYIVVWAWFGTGHGVEDDADSIDLLSADLPHTTTFDAIGGRQWNVTRGRATFAFVLYTERVGLFSSKDWHFHYLHSSPISTSCGFDVVSHATSMERHASSYSPNDFRPVGDVRRLTVPNCGALMGAATAFVVAFVLHLILALLSVCMSMGLSTMSEEHAEFERDLVSDETEQLLEGSELTQSAVPRAPMPSQQRMSDFYVARRLPTLRVIERLWRMAWVVLCLESISVFTSLVHLVDFVRTAAFVNARLGSLFYLHIVSCVVYLTLLPLALYAYEGGLDKERRRIQLRVDYPPTALCTLNVGIVGVSGPQPAVSRRVASGQSK